MLWSTTSLGLANLITLSRIALSFVFTGVFLQQGLLSKIAALIIFVIAALTDYWDGLAARLLKQESDFGKIMDPLADKFLTLCAFFCFYLVHVVALWMVVVIAVREILVTMLRSYAVEKSRLGARSSGKNKTFVQLVVIILILIFLLVKETGAWSPAWDNYFQTGVTVAMIFVVVLTLWSGYRFISENVIAFKK